MRRHAAAAIVGLSLSGPAFGQECPADSTMPLWHQAACDLAADSVDIATTISSLNANLVEYDVVARQFMTILVLGGATVLDLRDEPRIWMFQTTEVVTLGEVRGIIGPYLPRNDEENAAEAALVSSLADANGPSLNEVLGFARMMIENRGGRLLVGIGPQGGIYPMAVTKGAFCRWENVDFSGFFLLGSIEAIEEDGTVDGVIWRTKPGDCGSEESS